MENGDKGLGSGEQGLGSVVRKQSVLTKRLYC